jgi:acetoin utilization deacetylase AcuC-like enzyme
MRTVGFVTDPRCLDHLTGPSHPERPERLGAITSRVAASGLSSDLAVLPAQPASLEWIRELHDADYIERVRHACERGSPIIDSMDTGISERSYDVALLAAGAGLAAADAVVSGKVSSAFAAVRPPGHHALQDTAMGFCLFNNAAILARYFQRRHGCRDVFIIDWDVHHGNGTQAAFYDDPSVFYFSIHQWPFYPGSGSVREKGAGAGAGFTLNAPMPAGCGDDEYVRVFEHQVLPAMDRFHPAAVIISAGFDAHRDDPLAGMKVTESGYAALTRLVHDAVDRLCPGRLVSILEGGYDLDALASSVETHLSVLLAD